MDGLDLFHAYIAEREGKHLLYDSEMRGFIIYHYPQRNQEECFIDEAFVIKEARELRVILSLMRDIERRAKERGCKYLTCGVDIQKPSPEKLLKAYLWYGFKPCATNQDFVYMAKEI